MGKGKLKKNPITSLLHFPRQLIPAPSILPPKRKVIFEQLISPFKSNNWIRFRPIISTAACHRGYNINGGIALSQLFNIHANNGQCQEATRCMWALKNQNQSSNIIRLLILCICKKRDCVQRKSCTTLWNVLKILATSIYFIFDLLKF